MNDVLCSFLRHFVLIFFDDILIFSTSWAEHLGHVCTVLGILHQHRLFVKRSKCAFGAEYISYLGYIISVEVVTMDPAMVQAVADWPWPRSARVVRGFLSLAGYYRKFVKNYGTIATPLKTLLHKDNFSWSEEATAAFKALKRAINSTLVLTLPECDASSYGFGIVLSQANHPVVFFSRPIVPHCRLLAAYERELIGLVLAIRHWRSYLWG
jgi:hypothetical protein